MNGLGKCDPQLLDAVRLTVDAVCAETQMAPGDIMLVGARCRDILHSSLGFRSQLRHTEDSDLAFRVRSQGAYGRIMNRFERIKPSDIRVRVAGMPVDVIPFGDLEDPAGSVRLDSDSPEIVVVGFQDVYEHSTMLDLGDGIAIRLPTPAGYGALKLLAWLDRSAFHETKDARDIAVVLHWYFESQEIRSRSLGEPNERVLARFGFDLDLSAALLLGRDIARILSASNLRNLRTRWLARPREILLREMNTGTGPNWTGARDRRALLIDALEQGLGSS